MFEFKKICNEFENMTIIERGVILTEKSVKILAKLNALKNEKIDPLVAYASFVMGSIMADGKVNEQEYILMYPSLLKVFGDQFDFESIKKALEKDYDGKKLIKDYVKEFSNLINKEDEDLLDDIVILTLCIVSVDGKISLKEKRYRRRLFNSNKSLGKMPRLFT